VSPPCAGCRTPFDLRGRNLSQAVLTAARLGHVDLTDAVLEDAVLGGATLTEGNLAGVVLVVRP
jgi:uncharacterized protein YjbI with pentapeptide repeats